MPPHVFVPGMLALVIVRVASHRRPFDRPYMSLLPCSPSCIYVVGGLCDYKRIANATRHRASARGCRCARLPLERLGVKIGVEILTVDQVCQAALPSRKPTRGPSLCPRAHTRCWPAGGDRPAGSREQRRRLGGGAHRGDPAAKA